MACNAAISYTENHYPANEPSARRLSYPIPAIYIDFICSTGGLQLQCTPTSSDPLRYTKSAVKRHSLGGSQDNKHIASGVLQKSLRYAEF
jgi:hypothetical protein